MRIKQYCVSRVLGAMVTANLDKIGERHQGYIYGLLSERNTFAVGGKQPTSEKTNIINAPPKKKKRHMNEPTHPYFFFRQT